MFFTSLLLILHCLCLHNPTKCQAWDILGVFYSFFSSLGVFFQTDYAESSTLVSWVFCSAIPFQEGHRGLSLAELCRGDSLLLKLGVPGKLRAPGACTRLKSLKWNSLKMASLPSTSFHPTARRFGSSCSLSSVLSLWAFPAWQGKESEEE